MYILESCGRSDIPVYKGSKGPVNGLFKPSDWPAYGKDGIGDITIVEDFVHPKKKVENINASDALVHLCKSYKNVTILAIGPLTNLYFSIQLDPCFPSYVDTLVVMGGTHIKNTVEFNV